MLFRPSRSGFTIIEVLVVVAIISILAAAVTFFALQASQQSRDAKRQADLKLLQAAIEQYRLENGRYPVACDNRVGVWAGELGTDQACANGSTQYIVGLAPKYIPVLPRDPRRGTGQGYAYVTNTNGTVYKIIANGTTESELVSYVHPLKSCDVTGDTGTDIGRSGICAQVWNGSGVVPGTCADQARFASSYAVWGGFAPPREVALPGGYSWGALRYDSGLLSTTTESLVTLKPQIFQDTAAIICL